MMIHSIVPAGATISELNRKAADCEEKAKQAAEPQVARLREETLLIPRVDRSAAIYEMASVASRLVMSVIEIYQQP
jgi:hypothetical protein